MTIRQIAELHGVAPSTVSLVLNDKPGVRKETRQKIQKTLIENGYHIKSSVSQKGDLLFVYYKSTNYLAARKDDTITSILSGIGDICTERNYTFSVCNSEPANLDEILTSTVSDTHCGIILLGTEYYDVPAESFFQTSVPLVILDGFFPEYPLNTVNINNSYGVHQAISLLTANGHDKIGYLKSSIEFGCLRDRANCVCQSLAKLGKSEPDCLIQVEQETDLIQKTVFEYLSNHKDIPSAFFADNDMIAIASIQAFQRSGYKIPEDISIIGFDDSNICTIFPPHLTTVHTHMEEMARKATARLIDMIENEQNTFTQTTVGTYLVERQSVMPKKSI
mgnify:CR=1 FL=1